MGGPTLAVLVAVALGAAACGRIGYDERSGSDGAAIDSAVIDAVLIDADRSDGLAACPNGTAESCAGSTVCIEIAERGNEPWTTARDTCLGVGRRLCTEAEWTLACTCALGLDEMFNDGGGSAQEWEWVADELSGVAHKRGYDSCDAASTHVVVDPYDYRCCADR